MIFQHLTSINQKTTFATRLVTLFIAVGILALVGYAYGDGLRKPFVADDYQWLVNVRDLSFIAMLRTAFDPTAQQHFYRPLVWLLLWSEMQLFGTDPLGYHIVSLALHLLNAALLATLAYRLIEGPTRKSQHAALYLLPFAFVLLHPASFEAVTWVSAQSELLAALFLLLMLHAWLAVRGQGSGVRGQQALPRHLAPSLLATMLLILALLTKESAVIGVLLLVLFDGQQKRDVMGARDEGVQGRTVGLWEKVWKASVVRYLSPVLLTLAYVLLQVTVEQQNYLLQQGSYGLGWQLVLNPLRSLALIIAPLPGNEHADAAWLVPMGALVAVSIVFWIFDFRFPISLATLQSKIQKPKSKIALALGLTLLPTAPFLSPPDSRYLYLPVLFAALLIIFGIYDVRLTIASRPATSWLSGSVVPRFLIFGSLFLVLWLCAGEVRAREARWSAAGGPGGSLWRVAGEACAAKRTKRVVVVEPPLASEHAQAIVKLACDNDTQAVIVARPDVDGAVKRRTVVIAFPEGSAVVERRR